MTATTTTTMAANRPPLAAPPPPTQMVFGLNLVSAQTSTLMRITSFGLAPPVFAPRLVRPFLHLFEQQVDMTAERRETFDQISFIERLCSAG